MAIYVGTKRYAPYIGDKRRRYMGGAGGAVDKIIITSTSNAPLMAICYARGWAANADYMLKSEAEAVTTIGTVFRANTTVSTFDEFKYFTSVTSLDQRAFQQATLTSLSIPASMTSIGMYAFRLCSQMQSLTVYARTPPTAAGNSFSDMAGTVYVPAGSVDAYKNSAGWSSVASKIQAIPT